MDKEIFINSLFRFSGDFTFFCLIGMKEYKNIVPSTNSHFLSYFHGLFASVLSVSLPMSKQYNYPNIKCMLSFGIKCLVLKWAY